MTYSTRGGFGGCGEDWGGIDIKLRVCLLTSPQLSAGLQIEFSVEGIAEPFGLH